MNIQERNNILLQRMDMMGLNHEVTKNPLIKARNFNWNGLTRPPIVSYIPQNVINDITQLTHDPKLMNNPSKKYKLMNQALATVRFRPLASGTNRRAFYCEYDPGVILKIGSDRVGRSDNISEFYLQQKLKPFCCKIYDVLPNGVMSLMERGETMKLADFRSKWAKEIYDLIMMFLYNDCVLEDIGGNFYKNWAVRLDFGPILVDFPYLYRLDWSKLQCIHVDPLTGKRCDGELDYDYDKGMSEIVCEKCGSRYSANYLARMISPDTPTQMIKGRIFQMFNLPEGMKLSLRRGNKVVYSTYSEIDNSEVPIVIADPRFRNPQQQQQQRAQSKPKPQEFKQQQEGGSTQNVSRKFQFIKEDRMVDITEFLDMYCEKYGKGAAIDIARRLEIIYFTPEERRQSGYDILPQKGQTLREPQRKVEPANDSSVIAAYYEPTTAVLPPPDTPSESQLKEAELVQDDGRPKEGLYPVKPKTAEEIEREELLTRNDTAVMGFPGEPLVQTMKTKRMLPLLKQKIFDHLNHFELKKTEEQTLQYLKEETLKLVAQELGELIGCEADKITVFVNGTYDHLNYSCYAIKVEGPNGDPTIEVLLYSKSNNQNNNRASIREIAEGINPLEHQKPNCSLTDEMNRYLEARQLVHTKELLKSRKTIVDLSATMTKLLIEDLQKEKKMSFAEANTIAYNYIKEAKKGDIVEMDDIVSQL